MSAGLGRTVPELDISQAALFAKTRFSMLTEDVKRLMDNQHKDRRQVVLFGIEVHCHA
jgi:hypothetical protein